jgi:guanosine-3',5'-bis(diphosphate) 3'-pyrophosphohydrolase
MAESIENTYRPLLEAVAFAARAHHGQLRRDGRTPYHSHVFRTALVLREAFGVGDHRVLAAALLHDVIEDTTTDFDDLEKHFDREIAGWVALLSKDKRQRDEEREEAYCHELTRAPWQVQVCKLADVFDNLLELGYLPPEKRLHALQRKRRYLQAIEHGLKPEAAEAFHLVARLYAEQQAKLVSPL